MPLWYIITHYLGLRPAGLSRRCCEINGWKLI